MLRLDVRLAGAAVKAGVFVRAWPTFDDMFAPTNGYRLTLRAIDPSTTGWQHVEIECRGHTFTLRANGTSVPGVAEFANPQGYVALWASTGTAEFRAIEIKGLEVQSEAIPSAAVALDAVVPGNGVESPRLRRQAKPRYTADASAAKVQGTVVLTAVVLPDGTPAHIVVRRSVWSFDSSGTENCAQPKSSRTWDEGRDVAG